MNLLCRVFQSLMTLPEKCQRHERCTLHYIKNIARECTLASPYTLQEPTHPNSGCRVLNVTKPSNLGDKGLTASLPLLMALGLTSPGDHLAKCRVGLSGLHITWLTALHPSDGTSKSSVISEACANSTPTGPWWRCIPCSFQVLLLSPE